MANCEITRWYMENIPWFFESDDFLTDKTIPPAAEILPRHRPAHRIWAPVFLGEIYPTEPSQ